MHDEFQKMKVSMTESFRSLEATVNHMVEIVRMMKDGDGTASRSSQTVSSYPILSIVQSKTSPPKRRRARSTRISHQHHTFWSKRRHIPKRKRNKISPKKKRKKTMQTKRRKQQQEIKAGTVYKSSVCMDVSARTYLKLGMLLGEYEKLETIFGNYQSVAQVLRLAGLELHWMGDRPVGGKEEKKSVIWSFSRRTVERSSPSACSSGRDF
ncbi:hypothetical protein F2Q69_00031204 [Brassica cretica]|uniref:Uncharacterized protein n=1 Tax=Brassica cretica TaxID=69181 RepID=A0A8S9S713_BRACR|nr:hypothetical protein F2Q69_00031204 [Brassica cretica]